MTLSHHMFGDDAECRHLIEHAERADHAGAETDEALNTWTTTLVTVGPIVIATSICLGC